MYPQSEQFLGKSNILSQYLNDIEKINSWSIQPITNLKILEIKREKKNERKIRSSSLLI